MRLWVLAAALLVGGCSSTGTPATTPAPTPATTPAANTARSTAPPSPIDIDAAGPLCALLSGQDFHEVAGLPIGRTQGGGTPDQVTCEYGTHMELIVAVSPDVAKAQAFYQAIVGSGWFASNVKQNLIAGVDASEYGNAAEAAAVSLRRQKLVITVTVPGGIAESPLVALASRALSRAAALGR